MPTRNFYVDLNMQGNAFVNAGFEVLTALPNASFFAGRQIFYRSKPYWSDGKKWFTFPDTVTGNFWSLENANPEVNANIFLPSSENKGVFQSFFEEDSLKKSRDIIADFSRYRGGRIFADFFSAYFDEVYSVYPYEWAYEQETDLRFTRFKVLLCNNPFSYPIAICVPDSNIIKTNFIDLMTGLEAYPNREEARFFYLYPNESVMVDFELQLSPNSDIPILVNITAVQQQGTATYNTQRCSTESQQSIINSYLQANNIQFMQNKETGEVIYNVQDLLASLCSKLK
ncbi:MAG: hypothetical protein U0L93_05950 [Bacteroidales bacterium]|nr:hypothetical protein [Bacteroidales bacterium]